MSNYDHLQGHDPQGEDEADAKAAEDNPESEAETEAEAKPADSPPAAKKGPGGLTSESAAPMSPTQQVS